MIFELQGHEGHEGYKGHGRKFRNWYGGRFPKYIRCLYTIKPVHEFPCWFARLFFYRFQKTTIYGMKELKIKRHKN